MQVCRKLADSGYAIKRRKLSSDSKAEKHTAGLAQAAKKQFSNICRCSGARQLLVTPIWCTACRDGQLMPFGPHGTPEGFRWGSHSEGLPCTGASRSPESLTAEERVTALLVCHRSQHGEVGTMGGHGHLHLLIALPTLTLLRLIKRGQEFGCLQPFGMILLPTL